MYKNNMDGVSITNDFICSATPSNNGHGPSIAQV